MSKDKNYKKQSDGRENPENDPQIDNLTPESVAIEDTDDALLNSDDPDEQIQGLEAEVLQLKEQVEKEKKEYLFLMAEFDNFRKRTIKEKSELIRNGGEGVLKGLLPILDDFERGLAAEQGAENEGMVLIYNKLKKYLEQNGVKEFDPEEKDFDTEKHEAISVVPVPDESQKGKILDTVQKGYMLHDKVLRHAKVVVGQ